MFEGALRSYQASALNEPRHAGLPDNYLEIMDAEAEKDNDHER